MNEKERALEKEENRKVWNWLKSHKVEVIVGGVGVVAIIGFILGIKNRDMVLDLSKNLKTKTQCISSKTNTLMVNDTISDSFKSARTYTASQPPYNVDWHIRNLPGGRHHSAEKAAEALAMGIELLPTQTIVDSYTKGLAA